MTLDPKETKWFLLDLRRRATSSQAELLSQTNDGKIFGTVRRVKYDNIRKIQRNGMKDREKD